MRLRRLIPWLPAVILLTAALVVALLLITDNTKRIQRLEQNDSQPVITFTFSQPVKNGIQRFRVICKHDNTVDAIYLCSTIAGPITPNPTPSPTK